MAKLQGKYAPDGSLYVAVIPQTGNKLSGNTSPDGATYATKAG